jgi:beta-lactamase class A
MPDLGGADRLELEAIVRRFEGTLAACSTRLDETNATLDVGGDEVFPSASLILIPVALEVFCQIDEGALALGERISVKTADKVNGPGVLSSLADGLAPTIGDLVFLAMAINDHTAANLLIERVGIFAVNRRLAALGLEKTRLAGKLFVEETKKGPATPEDFGAAAAKAADDRDGGRGERSPMTARELTRLLACVHRRERLPASACEGLLETLSKTQTASAIRRGLPEARFRDRTPAKLHLKTGALRGVVNEACIVATERSAYAVTILTKGSKDLRPTQDNVGRAAITEGSRVVYRAMRGE